MEDKQIIELYWRRAEEAIQETAIKYGRLCQYIAQNILSSPEDSEECVNDAWLGLWNAIPPKRPKPGVETLRLSHCRQAQRGGGLLSGGIGGLRVRPDQRGGRDGKPAD